MSVIVVDMTLEATLLQYESIIRLTVFAGLFAALALWEWRLPRRVLTVIKLRRWIANAGVVIIYTVLLRLLFPAAAVGAAFFAQQHGWGVFHYLNWPYVVEFLLATLVLDLAIYLQHVMVHAVPLFWRFHRMHHADLDFDVTTGARFHPVEILFSMCLKFAVIFMLGPPLLAVVFFELLLSSTALFNHSNISLPDKVDRWLRLFVVTPDMHRVHHSVHSDETNSNFGFNIPWWDRLFGTYRAQPRDGHVDMTIGLPAFRSQAESASLMGMLLLPFRPVQSNQYWQGP